LGVLDTDGRLNVIGLQSCPAVSFDFSGIEVSGFPVRVNKLEFERMGLEPVAR
jgi:hypothetical protein